MTAERSEAASNRLKNPVWRCILKIARTEFPRRALRGSDMAGQK